MQRHHHFFLILGIIISLLNLTVCPAKTELTRAKAAGPAQPNFRTVLKEGLRNKAASSCFQAARWSGTMRKKLSLNLCRHWRLRE